MIKQTFKTVIIFLFTTFTSLIGISDTIDPAIILKYTDPSKDIIIREIENDNFEKIYLKAGNEKFGFSHILKKHSNHYFPETEQKGSLFPKGTTGKQILKGIETTYKYGRNDTNRHGNKKVLFHELDLNGKTNNYRLVINENNEVITFFRLRKSKAKA